MQYQTKHGPIEVNVATKPDLKNLLNEKMLQKQGFRLATLNLDHLVKMDHDPQFYAAYCAHDVVVADGNPIVWTASLAGQKIDVLPGSDLIEPLCEWAAGTGTTVAMIGSTEPALNAAADVLSNKIPDLQVVTKIAPPFGFDPNSEEAGAILRSIAESGAGLCFLALGAPKQEQLAARGAEICPGVGFASIGAGLDFLAGTQTRAPAWARRFAVEWVWRLLREPRRMWRRYLLCALIMPRLCIAALGQRYSASRS